KKALSQVEIQSSMNTAPAVSDPNLLAWWNFDETTASERDVPFFSTPVSSLRAASDGGLWIGTAKGVSLMPAGNQKVARDFTSAEGLAAGRVIAIFEDADGAMWFGSETGGVSRLNRDAAVPSTLNSQPSTGSLFTTITIADGLN